MSAAAHQPIILFDLPSRIPCRSWSLNPWKTRLYLNFKGIEYKTEWVEYPDIKGRFENYVAPQEGGVAPYTIPTIKLPDGMYIMNSKAIATHLETIYPTPSLHLDSEYLPKVEALLPKIMGPLRPSFLTTIPRDILNEAAQEHWETTRSKWVGMSMEEYARENAQLRPDDMIVEIRPHLEEMVKLYAENADGPFLLGKQVSYADFVWVGFLTFMERVNASTYEALVHVDREAFQGVHDACGKWLERDDH